MKLKTASSIMITATAVDTLLRRFYTHLISGDFTRLPIQPDFLSIIKGMITTPRFFLVKQLLWTISLLIFCVSLYRSERVMRLRRTSTLILSITTCISMLMGICFFMVLIPDLSSWFVNIGSRMISPFHAFWTSMRELPLAFLFLCFVLSGTWKRSLRTMAGILAVIFSLRYILNMTFLYLQPIRRMNETPSLLYELLEELSFCIYAPCMLIFFVLLTSGRQTSTALDMHDEESAGQLVHPEMLVLLFDFEGRISRSTYWLRVIPVLFILLFFTDTLNYKHYRVGGLEGLTWIPIISILLSLFSLWPALAAMTKRMHDRGYSAKWLWTLLIPFVNAIAAIWIIFVVWFLKGTEGQNRFGPDPLQPSLEV